MIHGPLTHPQLLAKLAACGHGSKILIADGNFPHATGVSHDTERIFLNLSPGLVTVDQVLAAIVSIVPLEAVEIMAEPLLGEAPAIKDFRELLVGLPLISHERNDFYETSRGRDVAVLIATGDLRPFTNLLLTVGVRG